MQNRIQNKMQNKIVSMFGGLRLNINRQDGIQTQENNNHKNPLFPPPLILKAGRYLPTLFFWGLLFI